MISVQKALLELVCAGATGKYNSCEALHKTDWNDLLQLISQHGVTCLAMHGLEVMHEYKADFCPIGVKLQLYIRSQQAMTIAMEKRNVSSEFAELVKPLSVVALKGVDYAQFWPKPLWREYGDLDCKCDTKGGELDKQAIAKGCKYEKGDFKHTHLFYKNLMIENHHSFTSYGGAKESLLLEKELEKLFQGKFTLIRGTALFAPNVDFTAIYLITHTQGHFFYEGINLRQILDWHFFLMKEGGNVDWAIVNKVIEKTGLKPFMELLTAFCKRYFRLQPQMMTQINTDNVSEGLLERFEVDLFAKKNDDHDRRWHKMIARMLHRYYRMWKFRSLMRMPIYKAIWRSIAYSSFLHRKPILD